jgi:UDP-N-acetylglucosamine transferase subunit ALG13
LKILVTVGTHPQAFDRLLKKAASWAAQSCHEWIVQFGASDIRIPGARQQAYYTPEKMAGFLKEVDLVLSHLGCGIAREVQEAAVPTLFMCRWKKNGEHIDDHQEELREALKNRPGLVFIDEGNDLEEISKDLLNSPPSSPEHLETLIDALKNWLYSG